MRKKIAGIITLFLITATSSTLCGQVFAPVGAKWHVQVAEPFAPEWTGTLTNESIRDTFLKGMSCKVIHKSQATIFNEISGEYILCQNGDSVFHYIEVLDSMNLVMNFGAQPGEFWESFDQANSYESFGLEVNYKYRVDSIKTIQSTNNIPLKVQYITELKKLWTEDDSQYGIPKQRQLIEHLGFRSALLPTNGGDGFTDGQFELDIRCYEDPTIGLVKLVDDENCITSSTQNIDIHHFTIHPNPTNGRFEIKGIKDAKKTSVAIFNNQAKLLFKSRSINSLNLEGFKNGVYYIQLKSNDFIAIKKIILIR